MDKDLVSIIIACYNGGPYIDGCLLSLINLSYKNIEIIICDDASKDNSWEKLQAWEKKDSRIVLIRNQRNLFSANARNNCIAIAKGQFLMVQDIDDRSEPDRIDILLRSLKDNNVDFVSSSMITINNLGIEDRTKVLRHGVKFPSKYHFLWRLPFNHPATLFSKDSVTKVGGYSVAKRTRRCEDYDLFMRLYASGAKGMNIDEPIYVYRLDDETFKRRTFSARLDEVVIRYKGFKALGIFWLGLPMTIRPIIVYLIKASLRLK